MPLSESYRELIKSAVQELEAGRPDRARTMLESKLATSRECPDVVLEVNGEKVSYQLTADMVNHIRTHTLRWEHSKGTSTLVVPVGSVRRGELSVTLSFFVKWFLRTSAGAMSVWSQPFPFKKVRFLSTDSEPEERSLGGVVTVDAYESDDGERFWKSVENLKLVAQSDEACYSI